MAISFWSIGRGLGAIVAAVMGVGLLLAPAAEASISTYVTPSGATTGGGPVSATATFTTSTDDIKITLTNLQNDPKDVAQALSDLSFTLNTGQTAGTLSSSSGQERTVNGNGTFSDGATVATGWVLDASSLHLDVLAAGGAGPAHLLIGGPDGSNVYSSANGSIAGNGPHNPFLAGTISFDLHVLGVTAASLVNSVTFSFGTTPGANLVPGVPRVPEPATVLLLGSGLVIVGALRWRRHRR